MKAWIQPIVGLCLLAITVLGSGCAALVIGAAAGASGAVYVKGRLQEVVNKPVVQVHYAAQKGLQDLKLPITSDEGNMTVKMKSGYPDGKNVWVQLKSLSQDVCQIDVRVGILGDEYRSREILKAIHNNLDTATPKK